MISCDVCAGLTPRALAHASCLHCGTPLPPRRRGLAALLLAPASAVLLAACYGPPGHFQDRAATPGSNVIDEDHDGYPAGEDCDDHDPSIHPGAPDPKGDGIDQNCDGVDGIKELQEATSPGDAP